MAQVRHFLIQSRHNQQVASCLLKNQEHRDWAITVIFYAALHFVNAGLKSLGHEFSNQLDHGDGHGWRARKIREYFTDDCFRAYRRLRIASEAVRYIANYDNPASDDTPSLSLFTIKQAQEYFDNDLGKAIRIILERSNKREVEHQWQEINRTGI